MYRRILIIGMSFLLISFHSLIAGQDGNAGLLFLKMGAGAKAVAMGEAYVAVANDVTSTYWNPAGLANLHSLGVHFTHNKWFQDVSHEFVALSIPYRKQTLGLSVSYTSIGDIEYRTSPTTEPLSTVSAHDLAVGFSYARNLNNTFAVGATVKYLHEKIYLDTASGFAIDAGMLYNPHFGGLTFGVSTVNIGKMGKMRQEEISLPTQVRGGIAWQKQMNSVIKHVTLATEMVTDEFEDVYFHAGFEGIFEDILALRAGYQFGYDTKDLSFGIGLCIGRYRLDYAYIPYQENLGNVQRFSIEVILSK